jgi:hypothetical protein
LDRVSLQLEPSRWFIRFPNLPLWQFLIDVFLVIDYWFMASRADEAGAGSTSSPLVASITVSLAFVLYLAWDYTAFWMRRDERYDRWPLNKDVPQRRRVTRSFLLLSLLVLAGTIAADVSGTVSTILVISVLGLLVVVYRFAKDWFYKDDNVVESVAAKPLVDWKLEGDTITITIERPDGA